MCQESKTIIERRRQQEALLSHQSAELDSEVEFRDTKKQLQAA